MRRCRKRRGCVPTRRVPRRYRPRMRRRPPGPWTPGVRSRTGRSRHCDSWTASGRPSLRPDDSPCRSGSSGSSRRLRRRNRPSFRRKRPRRPLRPTFGAKGEAIPETSRRTGRSKSRRPLRRSPDTAPVRSRRIPFRSCVPRPGRRGAGTPRPWPPRRATCFRSR